MVRALIVCLVLVVAGCHRPIDPVFVEPPMGTSYLALDYDGEKTSYIEHTQGVTSGITFGSFVNNFTLVALGGSLHDAATGTSWTIQFYFTAAELKNNRSNSSHLFAVGTYPYLSLDNDYQPVGERGIVISSDMAIDTATTYGQHSTTLLRTDKLERTFAVTRVYPDTNDPVQFTWVEGTFDAWMSSEKRAKGQFRIKVQNSLKGP